MAFTRTFIALVLAGALAGTVRAQPREPASSPPIAVVPAAERASDESIRTLLHISRAREVLEQSGSQMAALVNRSIQQRLEGTALSAQQQQQYDDAMRRMRAILAEALDWNALEPMYMSMYRNTFTQSEIDGMIAFYKTAAGQAVIAKLPLLMQQSMLAAQERIKALMPRIENIAQEAVDKIKAGSVRPAAGS